MKTFLLSLLLVFFLTSFIFSQTIQWQPLNGPFGGTPLCFVSKNNGDRFAGMDQNQGGIFRANDEESVWGRESSGIALEDRAINWLAVDDSGYIIAGTGSHIGAKVYKSKDNGESWRQISILGGTSVAVNDSGYIYMGDTGYEQYSVSKDGGYTWTHYTHPSTFIRCIEINDSGHIFVGGNYTAYRSTDNGTTWTTLSGGITSEIKSIAFNDSGHIFAGNWLEYGSQSGILKSTDNGDTWTTVKLGFRVNSSHNIVISNNGDIIVGSWGSGIWKSTDNGNTWNQKNSGLGHFYIKSMHISTNGNIYAGTLEGGIYRSIDNCDSWQQVGVTSASVRRIAISPTNGYIFTLVNGISRSTNNGQSWQPVNNGISNLDIRTITIKSDGTIFCGVGSWDIGIVYRSTNNGDSWERADNGLPDHDVSGLTFDAEGNVYVSIDYNGVYKSTNNGDIWLKIGNPPGGKLAFNSIGDLFLGSYGGGFWKLPAGDTTWVNLTSNYGSNWIYTFFSGSNDYLYTDGARSTDNGLTWTNMPLGNMAYSYAENSQGHLFAGTFNFGSGVKRSTDYGLTWESINSGLPTQDVRCVAVDTGGYLYAGPWGYSLYKTTTSTVTSVENEEQLPTTFYLEQNYPNPFNPSTVISYQLPVGGQVTLKVYDILGKEIATLVDEYKQSGKYEVEFNSHSSYGRNLGSGVYFYQIRIRGPEISLRQGFNQTKKMLLLK